MKKLLSLLLVLALAFSLAVPALADEDTGADYEAWKAAYIAENPEAAGVVESALYEMYLIDTLGGSDDGLVYAANPDAGAGVTIAEAIAAQKEALGLTHDINVMVDGKALSFTDAAPEIANDRTMVPLRAVMEGLGANVEYDNDTRTATIVKGDKTLSFVLGGDRFTVTESGETGEIVLDSVPYIKNDRVFVPVRFVGDALGYDVLWDNTYRTAVLIDEAGFVEKVNENFTILNAALAMGADLDLTQTYSGDAEMDLKVTMLDSINGDKTYTGSVSAATLQNNLLAYGAVKYDWAELMELLLNLTGAAGDADSAETQAVLDALEQGIETIVDLENGAIYLRGELMAAAFGVGDVTGDTWLVLDLNTIYGDALDFKALAEQKVTTVGELIYLLNAYLGAGNDPVYAYHSLLAAAEALGPVSDGCFTRDGDNWLYTQPLPGADGAEAGGVSLTIAMDGDKAESVKGGITYSANVAGVAARLDCEFAYSAQKADFSGSVQVKNIALVEFALAADTKAAPGAALPEVPADALDLGELLGLGFPGMASGAGLGIIGGADGPTAIVTTPVG